MRSKAWRQLFFLIIKFKWASVLNGPVIALIGQHDTAKEVEYKKTVYVVYCCSHS